MLAAFWGSPGGVLVRNLAPRTPVPPPPPEGSGVSAMITGVPDTVSLPHPAGAPLCDSFCLLFVPRALGSVPSTLATAQGTRESAQTDRPPALVSNVGRTAVNGVSGMHDWSHCGQAVTWNSRS